MVSKFDEVTNEAPIGRKSAVRALQAWLYLIGKATNRQIVKYNEVSELMGYTDNRPLSPILGCILHFCKQNSLPPLTIIVVNMHGIPGEGLPQGDDAQIRENVFNYNWFEIIPPTIDDFQNARENP